MVERGNKSPSYGRGKKGREAEKEGRRKTIRDDARRKDVTKSAAENGEGRFQTGERARTTERMEHERRRKRRRGEGEGASEREWS